MILVAALWTYTHLPDSSRFVYNAPSSHLKLELLKTNTTTAFLFLDQHHFTSPEITFSINGATFHETGSLRQGNQRIKLSPETTRQLILALQEQHEIGILADGFSRIQIQERYDPQGPSWLTAIKGPLE